MERSDYLASSGCVEDMMDAFFSPKGKDLKELKEGIQEFEDAISEISEIGSNSEGVNCLKNLYTQALCQYRKRYRELSK